jgi:hypothetical protein
MSSFTVMMCDVYEVQADSEDEAIDKLLDFVSGNKIAGVELVDEQTPMLYPEI